MNNISNFKQYITMSRSGKLLYYTSKVNGSVVSDSPIDQLLSSLGHCLMLSAKIAIQSRGLPSSFMSIDIKASKADTKPNRISEVHGTLYIDMPTEIKEERLLLDIKRLCTISNTLSCHLVLGIESDNK